MPEIERINANLATLADGKTIRFLNVNDRLADKDGRLFDGMMNERDKLHPTLKGYQVWADALKPILRELLGPPAATDHAPPPTGNPTEPASSSSNSTNAHPRGHSLSAARQIRSRQSRRNPSVRGSGIRIATASATRDIAVTYQ